ncbi:MAG: hypothetical protein Q8N05_00815 [Bacteroidota bacterium]|nr:hypothetical protein [Bacteroidota bacterium]
MGMKFMHLPKAKQFNITTRFYDPQKEAMKEREERIRREMGQETTSSYSAGIKGKFRNSGNRTQSKTVAEARRKSNIRLLYIVIILSILFYFLLK